MRRGFSNYRKLEKWRRRSAPFFLIRCCSLHEGFLEPRPSLGLVLANRLDPGGLQYRPQLRLVLRQEGGVVL